MDSNVTVSIIGSATTITAIIINQLYSIYDRGRKADEVKTELEIARCLLQAQSDKRTKETHDLINQQSHTITAELEKNTDVSVQAFKEANNVNEKIAVITQELIGKNETAHAASLASIDRTTSEINEMMKDAHKQKFTSLKEATMDTNEIVHEIADVIKPERQNYKPVDKGK